MLTDKQERYLQTIPEDKVIRIKFFDSRLTNIAKEIIYQVHSIHPDLEVLFLGAAALGIPGQGDLDLYICSSRTDFDKYLPNLIKVFGEPTQKGESIKWEFERGGYEVELYLTDPSTSSMQEQIKIHDMLKNSSELLEEYKKLKESSDGKSFREYQRRKYEFYNSLLEIHQ